MIFTFEFVFNVRKTSYFKVRNGNWIFSKKEFEMFMTVTKDKFESCKILISFCSKRIKWNTWNPVLIFEPRV